MTARYFVDTNLLVYCRDPLDPAKQAQAQEWLRVLWRDRSGRVSGQVLSEYYSVVTRKLRPGVEPGLARSDIRALGSWRPVLLAQSLMDQAWALEDRASLSWWDALVVAAAQSSGCKYLLTEDLQDERQFGGLTVWNPFTHDPA